MKRNFFEFIISLAIVLSFTIATPALTTTSDQQKDKGQGQRGSGNENRGNNLQPPSQPPPKSNDGTKGNQDNSNQKQGRDIERGEKGDKKGKQ